MFKSRILKLLKEKGYSSSQARYQYYAYKSFYIASFVASYIIELIFNHIYHIVLFGILSIYWITVSIICYNMKDMKNIIIYFIMASIMICPTLISLIKQSKFIKLDKIHKEKIIERNTNKRDAIAEKIQNIWLLDGKVISRKMWRKIKKISPQSYKKLRSGELTGHCYITTWWMLNILQDKDLKLMWILNTEYGENYHKYGHAVIKKGNYIYCPNQRRTYNAEKYLEAFETKVFKEMALSEYKNRDNPKDITLWFDEPKKVVVNRMMLDYFEEFKNFCKENGGSRSIEDEQDKQD